MSARRSHRAPAAPARSPTAGTACAAARSSRRCRMTRRRRRPASSEPAIGGRMAVELAAAAPRRGSRRPESPRGRAPGHVDCLGLEPPERLLAAAALRLRPPSSSASNCRGDAAARGLDALGAAAAQSGAPKLSAEARAVGGVRWKRVLLLVAHHLHRVLRLAQHEVGVRQLGHLRRPTAISCPRASAAPRAAPAHCRRRSLPPRTSCIDCTMNSISRMPPVPSFRSSSRSRRATSRAISVFMLAQATRRRRSRDSADRRTAARIPGSRGA